MSETSRKDELLEQLKKFGDPRNTREWPAGDPDYIRLFSLTERDTSQLLIIARQWIEPMDWPEEEDDMSPYAPIHAWRALAQLGAGEALPLFLEMIPLMNERGNDWDLEEFPDALGMLGSAVLPTLDTFLGDDSNAEFTRICVAHGLCKVAQHDPNTRDRVIEILEERLRHFDGNSQTLNAFLVSYLLDRGASESAESIERAYAAGRVDITVVGNWNTVREELGVKGLGLVTENEANRRQPLLEHPASIGTSGAVASSGTRIQEVNSLPPKRGVRKKRKLERQSRKRARRR